MNEQTLPQIAKALGVPDYRVRFAVMMGKVEPIQLTSTCHLYSPDAVKAALELVGTRAKGRKPVEGSLQAFANEQGLDIVHVRYAVKKAQLTPTHVVQSTSIYDPDEVTEALAMIGKRPYGRPRKVRVVTTIAALVAEPGYQKHYPLNTDIGPRLCFQYDKKSVLTTLETDGNVTVLDVSMR